MSATAPSFEDVIAAWNETLHCEMATQLGARCRRLAYWRADLHGCEQVLICTQHKNAYVRRARFDFNRDGAGVCGWCRKRFTCFKCLCKVVPL
jgi:hypothetical protein